MSDDPRHKKPDGLHIPIPITPASAREKQMLRVRNPFFKAVRCRKIKEDMQCPALATYKHGFAHLHIHRYWGGDEGRDKDKEERTEEKRKKQRERKEGEKGQLSLSREKKIEKQHRKLVPMSQ